MKHPNNTAVGSYQRVAARSSEAHAVDPESIHQSLPTLPAAPPAPEHHGRSRIRILAFSTIVVLLLAAFFGEFGSTIFDVRGGLATQSPSSSLDELPVDEGETGGEPNITDVGDLGHAEADQESEPNGEVVVTEEQQTDNSIPDSQEDSEEEKPGQKNSGPEEERTMNVSQMTQMSEANPKLLVHSWSAEAMRKRCPTWSADFASKFEQECRYWIPVFAGWEESLANKTSQKSVVYSCENDILCHGWGDRVSGMESAFLRALRDEHKFKIRHPFLGRVFDPCLFTSRHAQWTAQNYVPSASESCFDNTNICAKWNHLICDKPNLVALNADRACFPSAHCEGLSEVKPDFSAVSLAGCAMRAMFEPKANFLERYRFEFRIFGRTFKLTLKAIKDYLAAYYVIGMHVRLGDAYAFGGSGRRPETHDFFRPIRCAETLESYLADESLKVNGKKVIWLVATDTYSFKEATFSRFRDRIVGFDFKPKHIARHGTHDFVDISKEIAEWYILGLADQLIVTKWTIVGDIFNEDGRLSGFSRSAWLYNLKEELYFAGNCELEVVDVKGMTDLSKSCKNSTRFTWKPPQPHLEILKRNNKSFPDYYVAKGKVVARG